MIPDVILIIIPGDREFAEFVDHIMSMEEDMRVKVEEACEKDYHLIPVIVEE